MKTKRSSAVSPQMRDIAWAQSLGLLDTPLDRSLIRAWSYGVADDRIKAMIEGRIRGLRVKEIFGNLDPFQIPRLPGGEIVLGMGRNGKEARIPLQWLVAGALIAGNTGSGKTTLLAWLLPKIAASGSRIWVSEMYKTQVRHWRSLFRQQGQDLIVLQTSDWKFNLLQPVSGDPRTHLAMALDVMVRRLGLPPRARTILQQGCYDLYDKFSVWEGQKGAFPCLFDLWEWIRETPNLNAPAREAILDRLGSFLLSLTPECGAYRVGWSPIDLARFSIDFEMKGTSEVVKQVTLETLLYSILHHEIERGLVNAPISLFVAFEDSQRFFDAHQGSTGETTPMDELAGVVRGTGMGLGVIVQTMNGLSRKLVPNLATKIMGRMGSHDDYARLGPDLAMNREQLEWARRHLRPGMFVVQVAEGDWREPFIITVPQLKVPLSISDEEVRRSVKALDHLKTVPASEYRDWKPDHLIRVRTRVTEVPRASNQLGTSRGGGGEILKSEIASPGEPSVTKEELDYLESIAVSPFLGATQRDQSLNLGSWKGNKLRSQLLKKCLVSAVHISPGGRGRRFQLLEITENGEQVLSSYGIRASKGRGRGGVEHQWWAHCIAEWLMEKEIPAFIEDESLGARVDIVAETLGGPVAIEIEISRGHEMENIRKDLNAGLSKVVSLLKRADDVEKLRTRLVEEIPSGLSKVHVGDLAKFPETLEEVCFGSG